MAIEPGSKLPSREECLKAKPGRASISRRSTVSPTTTAGRT